MSTRAANPYMDLKVLGEAHRLRRAELSRLAPSNAARARHRRSASVVGRAAGRSRLLAFLVVMADRIRGERGPPDI